MKISIKSEPYIKCPKPKLTKKMFDWFWTTLWSLRLEQYTDAIETIDIRLNSALEFTPVHFYITINGVHKFHKEWDRREGKFFENETRQKAFKKTMFRVWKM